MKIKCKYPNCKKEAFFKQTFDLINGDNDFIELPFCKYHYLIVMGGHFKAKLISIPMAKTGTATGKSIIPDFELIGPWKEIEITEQVIAAREMILEEKTKL